MPTPDFILDLREKVGSSRLWLSGATAVVFRETDAGAEVLLVRRSDDGAWTPVAGIVDPGEHPHVAAIREVGEETGVVAEIERLVWLTVTEVITYGNGDETQYIDHVFRCRWVSGVPFPADGEASAAAFFSVDDLPAMSHRHSEQVRIALADQPETRLG
ncbi:MAG TPA: NUDIX domain-containing protein [Propionicimonas sp.]|nr:NUDIX domain-containing protein [Propionicimonas sp.]HRA06124.1 NUDIX domain-containing protein [Propionicimonas sp.]